MRGFHDPDAFPHGDAGLRRALKALDHPHDPRSIMILQQRWRPWRAYAALQLWTSLDRRPRASPPPRSGPNSSRRSVAIGVRSGATRSGSAAEPHVASRPRSSLTPACPGEAGVRVYAGHAPAADEFEASAPPAASRLHCHGIAVVRVWPDAMLAGRPKRRRNRRPRRLPLAQRSRPRTRGAGAPGHVWSSRRMACLRAEALCQVDDAEGRAVTRGVSGHRLPSPQGSAPG
jgi:hypothetical protein